MLVFGGSQGARSINHAAIEAFAGARFHVLHAAGTRDLPDLESPGPHYDLRGYITDFSQALLACDLVVARSGGSVFEVAAHGRPMVLIPYPHAAGDHQTENARYFERSGAAVVIADGELTAARLASEVGRLLADPGRLALMARASAALAKPQAAQDIAAEVLTAAGRQTRASVGQAGKPGPEPARWRGRPPASARAGQKTPPGGPPPQPELLPGGWVHSHASASG